jgi:hypothetical protein
MAATATRSERTDTPPLPSEAPAPWERQPAESGRAYEAFCTYRDLGPGRSVVEAYRQSTGKTTATQASGGWNDWVKRFRWEPRARTYDAHLEATRQRAVAEATTAGAEEWIRRRETLHENNWAVACLLRQKAEELARQAFEGSVVDPARLRAAAAVAVQAAELGAGAVEGALSAAEEQQKAVLDLDAPLPADVAERLERFERSMLERLDNRPRPPSGLDGAHASTGAPYSLGVRYGADG